MFGAWRGDGQSLKSVGYGFVGFVCGQRLCINFFVSRTNFLTTMRSLERDNNKSCIVNMDA